jgi:hypothetical protein
LPTCGTGWSADFVAAEETYSKARAQRKAVTDWQEALIAESSAEERKARGPRWNELQTLIRQAQQECRPLQSAELQALRIVEQRRRRARGRD